MLKSEGIGTQALAQYAGVSLLVLLLFGYWVYRLCREIKARRVSESELAMLYSNMSLGFALHQAIRDQQGKIVDSRYLEINPAFEKITGISRQQCIGTRSSRIALNSLNHCAKHFTDVETGKKPLHVEIHCQTTGRWFDNDSYQAGPNHFVVLLHDISERKRDELALKASEEKLRLSQYYGGIGIWEYDMLNNRRIWSEIVANGFGFPKTENPKWAHFLATVCKEDRPLVIDALRQHLRRGRKYDVEYRINVSGKKCWMRSVGQVERDQNGKPLRMLGIVHDISERKRAEEKLKLSARVFSDAHEGIMITDADVRIIDVNAAFTELTGYGHDDVMGKNPNLLKSGRQDAGFYAAMWGTLSRDGHWRGEIWNRHKDGNIYPQLLTISAMRNGGGEVINYIGLFSDISESKQHQQTLERLAHFDPLTGLPNRSLFADRFSQAIAHSKRAGSLLAVCYLDLDNFKPVNDSFGHETGDELLIEVSLRIKSNLREYDTVCRLGGDEFALLLQDLQSQQQCEETLRRIHDALADPFILSSHPVWIGASSGVTVYPLDSAEPDILLRHADQAMYQAKHAGRNCYRIYQDLIVAGILSPDHQPPSVE
ncbi:sensor domain-containing protein [Methylomonas sp. LL1]|uniref:sensor domain-containing protein n=1 Tax=Methylomonas sp. LL1 TaxID=2785785 RepID=UPI001E2B7AD6|nr:diguanylate cyclase [Methylomonas sp. LL1]